MEDRRDIRRAVLLSAVAALITVIPYLIAKSIVEPEALFSGFLINPVDGFSYLAKMQQGSTGGWLFQLPYAAEPGEGVLLFTFYLFLGKVVNLTGWSPQFVYHLTRVIAAGAMNFTAYLLITHFIRTQKSRWAAFLLFMFGSGFGWLGIPFGIVGSDLVIPESIPLYSAFANAHFPLSTTLFLVMIIFLLRDTKLNWFRFGILILLSSFLALIQPFVFIVLACVVGMWQLWELWVRIRASRETVREALQTIRWIPLIGIALGATPWLIYDYVLTLNHEAISIWNEQNLTPSPPPWEYIFGLGGVLILALFSVLKSRELNRPNGRLLIVWTLVQMVLLYTPFGIQRRLSLGLYFPLVILSIITLERIVSKKRFTLAYIALFALSIPSNLFVMASGLLEVSSSESELAIGRDEMASYRWLATQADQDSLVLANKTSGNRIPAFSNQRVLYGHPFETPFADHQAQIVENLLSPERDPTTVLEDLSELRVRYVLIGPNDLANGDLIWLEHLKLVFSKGAHALYEIP